MLLMAHNKNVLHLVTLICQIFLWINPSLVADSGKSRDDVFTDQMCTFNLTIDFKKSIFFYLSS